MHKTRNFIIILALLGAVLWALLSWFVMADPGLQRWIALALAAVLGAWLFYGMVIEDKMPDHLAQAVGPVYYEADGLCFLPIVRVKDGQAELCVYYQNRFENPVQGVVHLRPPESPDESFVIRPGVRDVHFAFKADGGDFGAIHQPIAVPATLQGQVIDVQLAAASHYPRGQGDRLCSHEGLPCGSLLVDWTGAAFKTGVHEVSGEIQLRNPATIHLAMPLQVRESISGSEIWRQERLAAAVA